MHVVHKDNIYHLVREMSRKQKEEYTYGNCVRTGTIKGRLHKRKRQHLMPENLRTIG